MKVFLATPITGHIDPVTLRFDPGLKEVLLAIRKSLRRRGHQVFLAIANEQWGHKLPAPTENVEVDYRELASSDVVLCLPGNPPSGGSHIELGWASALGKPIILLLDPKARYSPLVLGLHRLADIRTVSLPSHPTDQELEGAIAQMRAAVEEPRPPRRQGPAAPDSSAA